VRRVSSNIRLKHKRPEKFGHGRVEKSDFLRSIATRCSVDLHDFGASGCSVVDWNSSPHFKEPPDIGVYADSSFSNSVSEPCETAAQPAGQTKQVVK